MRRCLFILDRKTADSRSAEHARYVYKLQEATTSDQSDDERYDSDASSQRRPRKRMSIITNRYHDVDSARHAPRRFFKSAARWDDTYGRVRLARDPVFEHNNTKQGALNALMESGGRATPVDVNMDDDWEDGTSVS